MRRVLVASLTYLLVVSTPALAQDAMDFYKRGLKSSLAYKKIEHFTKAIELNPNLVDAYEKRAIHFYFQRKYDRAIQDYSRVIELESDHANGYRMLGQAYFKKGQLDGAIANLNRAIELDPKQAKGYGYRAEAYRLEGMAKEALRDSTRAIDLRGDERTTANAYATRAKVYRQLGEEKLSDADFDKSFELDPRYAIIRYFAGSTSLEGMRRMGFIGIVALILVGVFQLSLRAPRKEDRQ
jgi:tetratricopeptide (TPR) repeat protein